MDAIIGRKMGMTRIYGEDGTVVPVTVIEAGPCPVVQVRPGQSGGFAVQIGFGVRKPQRTTKAVAGHVKVGGLEVVPKQIREFTIRPEGDAPQAGDTVTVGIFALGERVKISGVTKGRGFQGVVKRYGFSGGPATHGSTRYRRPGSLGPGTDPSRVIKGKKMPGHYGAAHHTAVGLRVVKVDPERNLLYVCGAVPGPTNGVVTVRKQGGRGRYA